MFAYFKEHEAHNVTEAARAQDPLCSQGVGGGNESWANDGSLSPVGDDYFGWHDACTRISSTKDLRNMESVLADLSYAICSESSTTALFLSRWQSGNAHSNWKYLVRWGAQDIPMDRRSFSTGKFLRNRCTGSNLASFFYLPVNFWM